MLINPFAWLLSPQSSGAGAQQPRRHARLWLESLEDRLAPARTYDWVGGAGGNWSTPTNFAPAGLPGSGDIVRFGVAGVGANTNSTVDGANTLWHIAKLQVFPGFTATITIQNQLFCTF